MKQGRIVCGGGSADDNGDDASAGRAAKYTKPKANANDEKRQRRWRENVMQKLSLGGCRKFVRSRSQQMPKQRARAAAAGRG